MDILGRLLSSPNLDALVSGCDDTKTLFQPLEVCRASLTKVLVDIARCSEEDAERSIQWPNNIFNGDLAVVLPRLRPGMKADKLAMEIMEKVLPGRKRARFPKNMYTT
jgi:arginyl-tRNA synthetase